MRILPILFAASISARSIRQRGDTSKDAGAAAANFIPSMSPPGSTPPKDTWPYNTDGGNSLPHIRFAPVNHPSSTQSPSDALKPASKHLLFLADVSAQADGNQKPIAAALLTSSKEDVVNLGASDAVTSIKCEVSKLTISFKSPEQMQGVKTVWGQNSIVFLDAYGEGCGKPDDLQFMRAKSAAADNLDTTASSLTYDFEDVPEGDIVEEFKASWGEQHKEAISSISTSAGKRRTRGLDELDELFESDWPDMGILPPQAVTNQMQKREWTHSWDKKYDVDFRLNSDLTPFGYGKMIFTDNDENFSVSCVECGITGPLATSGAVSWSLLHGITGGTAFVSQSLSGQVAIGIESGKPIRASGRKMEKEFKKLFSLPLSPVNLGAFFIAGPSVSLEPFVKAELKTVGRLMLGGNVTWTNAVARHDFLDSSKSTSENWSPAAHPLFRVDAEMAAEAAAGVRMSLDFGLSVPLASWKKGISIVDEPSVYARASVGISAFLDEHGKPKIDGVQPPGEHEHCRGINFEMGLQTKVYFSVDIWENKKFTLWNMPPWKPFHDYCWDLEKMKEWYEKMKPVCAYGETCSFAET